MKPESMVLIIPIASIFAILIGIIHLLAFRKSRDPMHESIDALSTYIKDSLLTFFKQQFMLIGASVLLILVGSATLHSFGIGRSVVTQFVIWGILWSSVLGYILLRRSSAITGNLLQQALTNPEKWNENVSRIGWIVTLIPLGLITLELTISLASINYFISHNIFNLGSRIMAAAEISGQWTPNVMLNPTFETQRHYTFILISAGYCFGALIQTFLVRFTTQTMVQGTRLACDEIEYQYPGLSENDLRNPVSMGHHIAQYANLIWGKLSQMINGYLIIILSSLGIAIVAGQTHPYLSSKLAVALPLLSAGFILIGAGIGSLFYNRSLIFQLAVGHGVVATLTIIGGILKTVSIPMGFVILLTLIFSLLLAKIRFTDTDTTDAIQSQWLGLRRTWVTVSLTLIWIACVDVISTGYENMIWGIYGLGVSGIILTGSWLVYTAFSHRQTFIDLTVANAKILQTEPSLPEDSRTIINEPKEFLPLGHWTQIVIGSLSALSLLFVFLTSIPNWIAHVETSNLLSDVSAKILRLTTYEISAEHHLTLLKNISFKDLDFILGISPTRTRFLGGLFLSLFGALSIGVYWANKILGLKKKIAAASAQQLAKNPQLLAGTELPAYQPIVQDMTRHAFQTSAALGLILCLITPVIDRMLGIGGLTGFILGFIIITLLSGLIVHLLSAWNINRKESLFFASMELATHTILVFSFLSGFALLALGCSL